MSTNEWLGTLTKQVGLNEATTQHATSALFGFLKGQVKPEQFTQLLSHLPGADTLLAKLPGVGAAQQADGVSGGASGGLGGLLGGASGGLGGLLGGASGGLGGLASAAAGVLGGGDGTGVAGLVAQLAGMGLDLQTVTRLGTSLVGLIRQAGGAEILDKVLAQVPELKKLLGV